MPIKVGLVGRGYFGTIHESKWKQMPEVEYVGFHDILLPNSVPFEELLCKCDVLDIVTPPEFHFEFAKKAIEAEKHCFIEKPICTNLWDAVALAELATKHKVKVQVGHIEVFNHCMPLLRQSNTFKRFNKKESEDPVLDLLIHDLALVSEQGFCNLRVSDINGRILVDASGSSHSSHFEVATNCNPPVREVNYQNVMCTHADTLFEELDSFMQAILHDKEPVVTAWDGVRALNYALRIKQCLPLGNSQHTIWQPCNIYKTAIIGDNVSIGTFSEIGNNVVIGSNTRIGAHAFIPEGVVIEEDCFIGPRCTFANDMFPPSGKEKWLPTRIKKGARLGAGVCVRPGVTIGEGALIGMGAVVTKDVGAGETWAGVPAHKLSGRETMPPPSSEYLPTL